MIIALQNSTENDTLTRSLSSKRWSSGGSLSRFCPYCCEETERSSDSEVSSELLNKLILKLHKQMTDMQATLELERSEVKGKSIRLVFGKDDCIWDNLFSHGFYCRKYASHFKRPFKYLISLCAVTSARIFVMFVVTFNNRVH